MSVFFGIRIALHNKWNHSGSNRATIVLCINLNRGNYMLKHLEIKNFKAFGPTQKIALRPITLIYGANSSGKSSLLHSLLFVRESLEKDILDVRNISIDYGTIDLGGIECFSYKTQTDDESLNEPSISITLDIQKIQNDKNLSSWNEPNIISSFETTTLSSKIFANAIHKGGGPLKSAIGLGDDIVATVDFHKSTSSCFNYVNWNHPIFSDYIFKNIQVKDAYIEVFKNLLNVPRLSNFLNTTNNINSEDKEKIHQYYGAKDYVKTNGMSIIELLPDKVMTLLKLKMPLHDFQKFQEAFSIITYRFAQVVHEAGILFKQYGKDLYYFGPFREYPNRLDLIDRNAEPNIHDEHVSIWKRTRYSSNELDRMNAWMKLHENFLPYKILFRKYFSDEKVYSLVRSYEKVIESIMKLTWGELDDKRLQLLSGEQQDTYGFEEKILELLLVNLLIKSTPNDSDLVSSLLNEEIIDKTLKNVLNDIPSFLNEVLLYNTKRNIEVQSQDIGVGVSQLLPIIGELLAGDHKSVLIEEPEIHLHPALQSEVGDLFIEAAKGEKRKQIIAETHSEHILLRIMRRIRETTSNTLPEGIPDISADDVSILYVQQEENGYSTVIHLRMAEDGGFIDPWPNGFFEEGYNELFS